MNYFKCLLLALLVVSCSQKQQPRQADLPQIPVAIDRGFSEYIAGYTSGVMPVSAAIEIRFTPEFAATADRKKLTGLFTFDPDIKGKAEWTDDHTLVYRPSGLLDPGTSYTGSLNLYKIAEVNQRLKVFPINIQTVKKDFTVIVNNLEYVKEDDTYSYSGELITSDYVDPEEVEKYLKATIDRKQVRVNWDHSSPDNIHRFTVEKITRLDNGQELNVSWDGKDYGVNQKATATVSIPGKNDFSIQKINVITGEAQRIEIVLTQPVDESQEMEGLIWFSPQVESVMQINSNIISLIPATTIQGSVTLNIEASLKSMDGILLGTPRREKIEFTMIKPGLKPVGKGVILPASGKLIFPFMAANLRSVDLRIVKIFENNLPYFLQANDLNEQGSVKRFGRPVYSGKIDLLGNNSVNNGKWNMHTIDLSEYITVEPGVLYMVRLGMKKSYSLYSCGDDTEPSKYEEMLAESEESLKEFWDDPDNYYDDYESSLFYRYGYDWDERDDPCKEAYFSPNRSITRNLLASNLGLMAKMGAGNKILVFVNDIRTTEPVNEASVEIFNYQLQVIASASTAQDGTASLQCNGVPFMVIVKKGTDRNYLKTNDGSALSLSSFDVSGVRPVKGIKTFIYGERDVWRPGDSIFLSVIIRDMKRELPAGHPVQFELVNPLSQRTDFQVQNLSESGLLVFRTKTPDNAVTGNYDAVIRVGGAVFTKRVRIETVKPNRLKIELDFLKELLGETGEKETGMMKVKWLNGAIARNLKATVEMLLKPVATKFEKYPQYSFDDPASTFSPETINIFDGTTDDRGNAAVDLQPGQGRNSPGMMNALFTIRVFEKGGDASIIQKSYRYTPFSKYVGVDFPALTGKNRLLYTDAENQISLVTLDSKGNPVNEEVEINIYKINYRWWWESDDDYLGSYIAGRSYRPVLTRKITTANGEAMMTFRVEKNEWGRYLVRATAASGHSSGKIILIDWPWGYGSKGTTEGATLLTVNTDREKYNVGDNIQLSFPAPENSRAIVTLENATEVVEQVMVNVSGNNSIVNLKAKPDMAPNVFAYVTLIQPHSQTSNDMPVRLYGVVPVMVEDASTRLSPELTMPDEIRSQQTFDVKVGESGKKPMTYTLAIVDEGLLDLTGFRTPDPWNYFYAREALGVKTWDLYDMVLGALGGRLDRAFATGGDEALKDKSAAKAKRFIPVVKFLGPFSLEAGRTNTHSVTLPLYTGSVKAMIIAGNDRSFGFADKQVFVRDPLMILATAPRVLGPAEKVTLPLTLFIQKDNIRRVTVEAAGNELISFAEKKMEIDVAEQGEKEIEFEFSTADRTGKAVISIKASGGGETAVYNMEIEVRSPNPPETRSELKVLPPGGKYEKAFIPFGIEGTGSATLEISSLPSVNLETRLKYLVDYPHGCSEQVTSAIFPQLWLKNLTGTDQEMATKASVNITTGLNILMTRQMVSGGIALWPGAYQPDSWVTSYAGHFMLEAERLGYSIPPGFRQKWLRYQKNSAQSWRYDAGYRHTASDQAYRLFTLALAGQPDKGAMNRLRETPGLPQLAKWLLAATFATTGRGEVAEQLIDVRTTTTEPDYYDYYYGSYLRDRALILYTLTVLKKNDEALPLLKIVCDELNSDSWFSTQTIAWGLFAYMKFAEQTPSDVNKINKASMDFNGLKKEVSFTSSMIGTQKLEMKPGNNLLKVENVSDNPVYVTFIQKGIPLKTDILREEKGIGMTVSYYDMALSNVNESLLEQGTDFMMTVKVTNNTFKRIENIALTQMVPPGWEIQNTRLFEASMAIKESGFDYRDFRDDRVYTYFSLNRGETRTFLIILNAAYRGSYYQPAVWCEAMYTENIYSRIPGREVSVTAQKIE